MDRSFLELFGNLLIGAARGKKQVDEMLNWIHKGYTATRIDEIPTLFRKFYGLDQLSERSSEYKQIVEKSVSDFQKSLQEYLQLMGMTQNNETVVPKEQYLELLAKYEKIKEKCEDQQETIKHLRMLLQMHEFNQNDFIGGLQDIVKGQTELFQKMIKGFGGFLTKNS